MNTQLQQEISVHLPEGFTARGATMNDIEPSMAPVSYTHLTLPTIYSV